MKGYRCHYCGKVLTKETRTKDHKVPRSQGGSGKANYLNSCWKCNNDKGDMSYEEYIAYRKIRPLGIKKADGTFLIPRMNLV